MKQSLFFSLSIVLFFIFSCSKDNRSLADFTDLNLSDKGFPMTVKVPKGTVVLEDTAKRTVKFVEKSIVLKGDRYHVRIEKILAEYANPSLNPEIIKINQLNLEKTLNHKGEFKAIVKDEPAGFVYSTTMTPRGTKEHFYYVCIKEGRQIECTDYFSVQEEPKDKDIELMYESMKQE